MFTETTRAFPLCCGVESPDSTPNSCPKKTDCAAEPSTGWPGSSDGSPSAESAAPRLRGRCRGSLEVVRLPFRTRRFSFAAQLGHPVGRSVRFGWNGPNRLTERTEPVDLLARSVGCRLWLRISRSTLRAPRSRFNRRVIRDPRSPGLRCYVGIGSLRDT